ncbi:MAG: GFA family protein [Actinobacteria bacterium]|nr:GFA family protein [Actinomycetota bacterium]
MSELEHRTRIGRCACGGVRYRIDGPVREVMDCHCEPCRRITGHHMAATSAAVGDVVFDADASLSWYAGTPTTEYGFCSTCGSTLFWRAGDKADRLSIAAGSLDGPTGLSTVLILFGDEAADYHRLDPGIETLPGDH